MSIITPGVCPPEGCPSPTRIECIITVKVYDSCFQVASITKKINISTTEFTSSFNITLLITVPMVLTNPFNPPEIVPKDLMFTKVVLFAALKTLNPIAGIARYFFVTAWFLELLNQMLF